MLASFPGWLLEFLHTIYLSLGSHNKNAVDLWLKQQKFLMVLEVASPWSRCQLIRFLVKALFCSADECLPAVSSRSRESKLSKGSAYKGTNPILRAPSS